MKHNTTDTCGNVICSNSNRMKTISNKPKKGNISNDAFERFRSNGTKSLPKRTYAISDSTSCIATSALRTFAYTWNKHCAQTKWQNGEVLWMCTAVKLPTSNVVWKSFSYFGKWLNTSAMFQMEFSMLLLLWRWTFTLIPILFVFSLYEMREMNYDKLLQA